MSDPAATYRRRRSLIVVILTAVVIGSTTLLTLTTVFSPSRSTPRTISSKGASSSTSQVSSARDSVKILSTSSFADYLGYTNVVGELTDNGTHSLSSVQIDVNLYDLKNNVMDHRFSSPEIDILAPGQKSPFHVVSNLPNLKVDHYGVAVINASFTTESPDSSLKVHDTVTYIDKFGYYNVVGQVTNAGPKSYAKLVTTFYGNAGKLVDVTCSGTSLLLTNETSSFDITNDLDTIGLVSSYVVQAAFGEACYY